MAEENRLAGYAFISYVREDSAQVDGLQHTLEAAGIRVWRDTANLWPGEDWRQAIRRAITDSALVFIACFSSNSLARRKSYQSEELLLATEQLRLRRPDVPWLIPVRLDECQIPDYDIGRGRTLNSIQRIDVFGDLAGEAAARLATTILRIFGQQTSPSSGTKKPGPESEPVARRACIALDVAAYASITSSQQAGAQLTLESIVTQACRSAFSEQDEWEYQSTSDGLLTVSPPGMNEADVLIPFIISLHNEIRLANRSLSRANHLRVRAAIAFGRAERTKVGFVGEAVAEAAGLLDSTELRQALDNSADSGLAAIITNAVYRATLLRAPYSSSALKFRRVNIQLGGGFSGDAWIYVPQTSEGDGGGPLFFVSYARPRGSRRRNEPTRGPSGEVKQFFEDLTRNVENLVAWPYGTLGFIDKSIEIGNLWSDDLLHAVGTCQVFIALISVSYLESEWCAMEWDAFSQRKVVASWRASTRQTCIIPVVWAPVPERMFPGSVQAVQRFSLVDLQNADDGQRYQANGVFGLLASAQTISYQRVVWQLAQQIKEIHQSHLVTPSTPRQNELRNIFWH